MAEWPYSLAEGPPKFSIYWWKNWVMVISENFVWFTNENNRRLNVKVISSYINEREENFLYQKLLQKQKKNNTKMNILGIFILFLQTFAVPVFNQNEVMTRISRSAHQIKRNPCAKYLRRNHHINRFGGYGISVADNKSKYNLCMRMLVKKLRAKKLSG